MTRYYYCFEYLSERGEFDFRVLLQTKNPYNLPRNELKTFLRLLYFDDMKRWTVTYNITLETNTI